MRGSEFFDNQNKTVFLVHPCLEKHWLFYIPNFNEDAHIFSLTVDKEKAESYLILK